METNGCLGRGQSKLWLSGTAISILLFYLLILPMELYFFGIWVPSLLGEHNERLRDPTLIKQFPSACLSFFLEVFLEEAEVSVDVSVS